MVRSLSFQASYSQRRAEQQMPRAGRKTSTVMTTLTNNCEPDGIGDGAERVATAEASCARLRRAGRLPQRPDRRHGCRAARDSVSPAGIKYNAIESGIVN